MTETSASPAPAAASSTPVPATESILETLKARLAAAEARLPAVEARLSEAEGKIESLIKTTVQSVELKVKTWAGENWPHVVTWVGTYGSGIAIAVHFIAKL